MSVELPHPGHALHQAHGGLGKQLGPFPVGVWLLIVVGGLGIAWYARRSPATAAADPLAGTDPTQADLSGGLDGSGGSGQIDLGGGDPTLPPPVVTPPATTPPPVVVTPKPAGGSTTPVTKPAPHPTTKTAAAAYYVVRRGDTLTHIAATHHTTVAHLYTLNRTTLENTARRHGKASSGHGHWIWPGERLRVK